MVRIEKLYSRLLASRNQTISFREFENLLEAFGFRHVRTTGSHRQYAHPKLRRPLPVQPSSKDAKAYHVREFLDLVEEHGLYIEP
ncbi:type II toxin-antitoxin system HicA family toxin [Qipengyuania sediminis]|uniref:type II toxin-antitoxin system HicA family toxin n=1 Tax=Qipengyuania sediminis TaxID=1532023 RepID=UPI0010597C03|nr:type II toxin-antitoxin system HicA family toxin [Qipengyuania sediminis]